MIPKEKTRQSEICTCSVSIQNKRQVLLTPYFKMTENVAVF